MLLGYNTNGLTGHSLPASIELLSDLGYRSIAITIDHHTLNPFSDRLVGELAATGELLQQHELTAVIETGARFLLDPLRKHHPTLVSQAAESRERRIDFLRRAIDIGAQLNAPCVSVWSGAADDDADEPALMERLADSLRTVLNHAADRGLAVAFEPEPGHFVDTMVRYNRLLDALGEHAGTLALTIDVGHLHCQGETPITDYLTHWKDRLCNVHIEDMRAGMHEHLLFGEGEIDFPPVIRALRETEYEGPVTVELSRHSHMGPEAAQKSMDFLKPLIDAE